MFSQLIEVLGAHASQYIPRLLEILFYCLGLCKDTLEQREKVRDVVVAFRVTTPCDKHPVCYLSQLNT